MLNDLCRLLVGIACALAIMHVSHATDLEPTGWSGTHAHLRTVTYHKPSGRTYITTAHVVIDEWGQPRIEWACDAGERPPCALDDAIGEWEVPEVTIARGPAESCTVRLEFPTLLGGYHLAGHIRGCDWSTSGRMTLDGKMFDGSTMQSVLEAH